MPEAWTRRAGAGAPGGRGAVVAVLDSGVAYERHGALPARARPAPLHLRPPLGLRRPRPPPERRVRARHPRGRHDRPDDQQRHRHRRASPTARRSCRCACSTRTARATRPRSRAAIRYAVAQPRRRDQPVARVRRRGARRRDPRHASARSATRTGAAWSSWRRPATRPTSPVAYPARANERDRRRRHHRRRLPGRLLERRRATSTWSRPGGGVDAPNADSAWDAAHCNPDASGRPIFQQTFTARRAAASGCRAATRARRWRARTSRRSRRC